MTEVDEEASAPAISPRGRLPPPLLLVLNNEVAGDDDEEVLFNPDSPRESKTSSVGTPPTPDQSKFVWPSSEEDDAQRVAEPATHVATFDSFVLPPSIDASAEEKEEEEEDGPALMASAAGAVSTAQAGDRARTEHENDANESRANSRASVSSESESYASSGTSQSSQRHSTTLNATLHAVKQKTQQAATQPRDALSRFQGKGGLVGWLHGEESGSNSNSSPANSESDRSSMIRAPMSAATSSRNRASSLFGNIYDKMKRQHEQLELKLQRLEDQSSSTPSMPAARPVQARRSLQPSQLRAMSVEDAISFDNFVSSSTTPPLRRDSRLRSASSSDVDQTKAKTVKSRLRSISFASRSSQQPPPDLVNATPSSALQWDSFPLEDCLADPKLAAEFINTVLPGDEWLLTLLYSIEEYEALTTAAPTATTVNDPAPSLETQIMMAITIVNRFLATSPQLSAKYPDLEAMGKDIRAVITQYQLTYGGEGSVTDTMPAPAASAVATLPVTMFDAVYTFVVAKLRDAYDSSFRQTRQYTLLLAERKQSERMAADEQSRQHLVLTFDQVIESEWCCTVFFMFLFRTSHHHRLSFIMDVKFKLRRLYAAAQQSPPDSVEAGEAYRQVRRALLLICRRFLQAKSASLALPTTSPMLARLRDEVCGDASVLEAGAEPDITLMQRMIDKLDTMRTQTRADFKRMSFERFASFLTSSLYRDFILQPGSSISTNCSRADDLIHLLRVNRISFHQTPLSPPSTKDLLDLTRLQGSDALADAAVAVVFEFQECADGDRQGPSARFNSRCLFESSAETRDSIDALIKTVDAFLIPERSTTGTATELPVLPPVCFNFLAGAGDSTVYGAVWRTNRPVSTTEEGAISRVCGVCIVSRYPLVDALRVYLRSYEKQQRLVSAEDPTASPSVAGLAAAVSSFSAHCSAIKMTLDSPLPAIDFSFQDLFECLSITHAMRLFSLALQEKKIILVSSSYSVLLSVGEALRTMLAPLAWSHIYVPVLPLAMRAYLHCPTPFVFGLHTSYAKFCELPKPSDDLAVVNLDRDSVTGGGDVYLPPTRAGTLRDRLTALCKPRLLSRDAVDFCERGPAPFPSDEIRQVFHTEVGDILAHLETFAFRFDYADRTISIVDSSNKARQWPPDTARFYSTVLQSQAFSSYLGSPK